MKNYDVFISHSHKDKVVADAICHHFEQEKIKCWIAPRNINPGTNWAHSIADAIPQCKILLLIFSSHSNISDQVLREVELAVKNKLIIVPVKIEDISPVRGMEYYLSTVHWIDVVNKKTEKYINDLINIVQSFLNTDSKKPVPVNNTSAKKKRNPLVLWLSIAAVVIVFTVLGIVFRDSLFNNDASLDASTTTAPPTEEITPELTEEPTAEPTPSPTAEPTPSPLPTIDPNISLDTVVEIPNITLKSCILKTLSDAGTPVKGSITVGDMHNLTKLVIVSQDEYDSNAFSNNYFQEDYGLVGSSNIQSLEGLQYAKNLETLVISGLGLEDIGALIYIYNLKSVYLPFNEIEDISALSSHGNLTFLELMRNPINSIEPLVLCYNLEYIDLTFNFNITDLSPLKGMFSLKDLCVEHTGITSLEPIRELTKLEHLSASGNDFSSLNAIDSLNNLDNLIQLDLGRCNISQINLEPIEKLTTINLQGNPLDNIDCFLDFTNLRELYIHADVSAANNEVVQQLRSRGCAVFDDDHGKTDQTEDDLMGDPED